SFLSDHQLNVSVVVARAKFRATMAPAPSPIIITPEYAGPAPEAELAAVAPEDYVSIISSVAPAASPPATFAPAEPPIIITAAEDAPEAPVPDAALPPAIN
ncbi:unnamed protein product, partial [Linum tenue]